MTKNSGMVTMADTITRAQLDELQYPSCREEFHELLKKYAGITAVPYTAFSFYDEAGNYLGDDESDVMDLLNAAYIKVED